MKVVLSHSGLVLMLRRYTQALAKLLSYINLSGESFTYEKDC